MHNRQAGARYVEGDWEYEATTDGNGRLVCRRVRRSAFGCDRPARPDTRPAVLDRDGRKRAGIDLAFEYLRAHPGCTARQIAAGTGLTPRRTQFYVRELARAHKARYTVDGSTYQWYAL